MDNQNKEEAPTQEVIKLSELIKKKLTVPNYQRPYKWKSEQVIRLLDDIFEHIIVQRKGYRIGSVILFKDEIVDGQQRLTTISILLRLLNDNNVLLLNQNYTHKISQDNIVYNARIIKNWLTKIADGEGFKKQLLNRCEFILFTVFDTDEAFQLFDSQNARGKALEPYDLLKAFHLREMETGTEDERALAAQKWEMSIDEKVLKPILNNHLFKIRKWSRNESKYDFKKGDIDEFKGVSLYQKQKYPFESTLRMLDGFVENAQNDKFLKNSQIAQCYPFSITMPIINGKRFFEYIDFYIQLKKIMLSERGDDKFNTFYGVYCLGNKKNEREEKYDGSWRSGDEKVRNLYENILLLFVDKFGYTEDFERFYKAFYKETYTIRCNNKSIRLETILNSDAKIILQKINNAFSPDKLNSYQFKNFKVDKTEMVKGVEIIKNFINGA